jgi:DNA-directed RNA polymerase specialized sigma24 family protein
MSPATLRRYRAERMLRQDFESLRGRVLAGVRARLRAVGAGLDDGELEACYATAWQGLYEMALQGREVADQRAWLGLVTYRRAIEEHRSRLRRERLEPAGTVVRELEAQLDDRHRIRQLFEGMRASLDVREREAAALCYLHGLSRSEAARRMGISETRMRKLMEGTGAGRPGVSAKLGGLVETISEGTFCEQRQSLMRALAYGLLDPDGERHRLATMHRRECPACRSYVASLRGLAAALPPTLGRKGAALGTLAALRRFAHRILAPVLRSGGSRPGSSPPLAPTALPASAGAGGGWLVAGGAGGKLVVGCLLALGVGAGCVALGGGGVTRPAPGRQGARAHRHRAGEEARVAAPRYTAPAPASSPAAGLSAATLAAQRSRAASREFGPEQPAPRPAAKAIVASAASAVSARAQGPPATHARSVGKAAEREFSPG